MERRKLTKEDLDKVRHIEGFPIGKDEDIIALSDAPYYTACPNPFIKDFIRENGTPYDEETDDYHREPFAADVSEGKKDPIYNAHSYHTKVPYKAIMRYVLHYTKPGDIVFDGFCGTGMTGVAAQMCGTPDPDVKVSMTEEMKTEGVIWGARKAILCDLAPAATFIADVYNSRVNPRKYESIAQSLIEECKKEMEWMFTTVHIQNDEPVIGIDGKPVIGHINYTVWSDVFICPSCSSEVVFWDTGIDKKTGSVRDSFACKRCGNMLLKRSSERAKTTYFDRYIQKTMTVSKQVPVFINYSVGKQDYERPLTEYDYQTLERIDHATINTYIPIMKLPTGFNTEQPRRSHGIEYIHQFFTNRNLLVLGLYWRKVKELDADTNVKNALYAIGTGVMMGLSKLQRYRMFSGFPNMLLSGTLYIGSMVREWNALDWMGGKLKSLVRLKSKTAQFSGNDICISTLSSTQITKTIPENSVDYIFTDPPFGGNLNYSELSSIWESWIGTMTANREEAIINDIQKKKLSDYQALMQECFTQFYTILKPGHWITVEFHNSHNSVWNALSESLMRAGFVIADIRVLDKKQGSFKQIVHTSAVKQDLVISAYKPKESFRKRIVENAGQPETVWAFIRQHLANLPVVVDANNDGKLDVLAERQAHLLFDRMVAYHIMQGIPVPLDATDFYRGLDERFLKRDGMYFLPEQVNEYDTARIHSDVEDVQLSLIVSNEKSAIEWLYRQLETPQTYAELQPKFMQEVRSIDKYEALPELSVLLEENFLQDDKGRWYIPDVTKEADVAKLREKSLIKEFEGYLAAKGKLKLFRSEAIRAGFAKLWKEKNYKLIVETAERLPEKVIQEDDKLLMYYDLSLGRV